MPPQLLAFLGCMVVAGVARAQGCPEGDWFCEPAPAEPEGAPLEELEALPGEPEREPPEELSRDDAPHTNVEEPRRAAPPLRSRRDRRRWGFEAHALGALIAGSRAHPDAGMGGVGLGVRYRPNPHFAVDTSLELAFGTDYNGRDRSEVAVLADALAFFNVRSPLQPYILAGLGVSSAEVALETSRDLPVYYAGEEHYVYLGLHLGVGIELRLTRLLALRLDVLGFVRTRADGNGRSPPEFIDPETRRATNTSGGSFARVGAVFYF